MRDSNARPLAPEDADAALWLILPEDVSHQSASWQLSGMYETGLDA